MSEKVNTAEAKVIEESKDQYRSACDDNVEWLTRAKESYQFYTGIQQWDTDVLDVLAKEGRPALQINLLMPIVNLLCGYQRQNRSDIKLYPRSSGSTAVAELGSELIKHTMDVSGGIYEESDAFFDGVVCGKGWIGCDVNYLNDPLNGDIAVEKESPFAILEDQKNRKYDINQGDFVFKTWWWNKRQIELQYPGKAKYIEDSTSAPEWIYDKIQDEGDYTEDLSSWEDEGQRSKSQYRIRERWYKKWEKCTFLIHIPTLSIKRLTGEQVEQVKHKLALVGGNEFRIIDRPAPVLYKAVSSGDVLLEHIKDPFDGLNLFPFFRFCPYLADGYVFGVIDNLKDPMREVNKRRSQELHHLNLTVHSGWMVGDDSNEDAVRKLEQFGSRPGVVICPKHYGGSLERIEPGNRSIGYEALSALAAKDIQNISGINPSLLEQTPEPKESGRAKMLRQQAGLTVSEMIFDNWRRTQQAVGYFLWELIRTSTIYTQEEITAVVQEHNLKSFIRSDETGRESVDLSAMRGWRLGRYGVKVSQSANVPTIRMANYEMLLDAMKQGLPVPPEFLIELSDLPNKDEIISYLQKVSQLDKQRRQITGAGQQYE
jgi:hypothetical protein